LFLAIAVQSRTCDDFLQAAASAWGRVDRMPMLDENSSWREIETGCGLLLFMQRQTFPKAIKAVIYAGRSYAEGKTLKVVTK
jgi:hypothetical protein